MKAIEELQSDLGDARCRAMKAMAKFFDSNPRGYKLKTKGERAINFPVHLYSNEDIAKRIAAMLCSDIHELDDDDAFYVRLFTEDQTILGTYECIPKIEISVSVEKTGDYDVEEKK